MRRVFAFLYVSTCLCAGFFCAFSVSADAIAERAKKLHFSSSVLDTHADTPQRMLAGNFDLGKRDAEGHVDIPRMREGGLNVQFFSIFISGRILGPPAIQQALDQIDIVRRNVQQHSKNLMVATTAEEIRRAHAQGKIAILMGMEGGHMIGNDIHMMRNYAQLGVRYMTLAHFHNDEWAESSTDKPAHNGLTDFGKEVVREMNRQGMLMDISHVSDKTFYDALEVSEVPLIASHSSVRAISRSKSRSKSAKPRHSWANRTGLAAATRCGPRQESNAPAWSAVGCDARRTVQRCGHPAASLPHTCFRGAGNGLLDPP
jgi:membrane dipeptidase